MSTQFPTLETSRNQPPIYATMKQEEDVYTRDLVEEFGTSDGSPLCQVPTPASAELDGTGNADALSSPEPIAAPEKTAPVAARDGLLFPELETGIDQTPIQATMKQEAGNFCDAADTSGARAGYSSKPTFVVREGTWREDAPSDAELLAALEQTAAVAARGGLPFRHYFRLAAESLTEKLQAADRRSLWRRERKELAVSQGEIGAFASACMAALAFDSPTIRIKMRRKRDDVQVGVYVPSAGSLIARAYGKRPASIEFSPGMESFFLPSYRDGAPSRYVPEAVWDGKIGAQALCEAGPKTPSLKPFTVDGKLYVTTGGMFSGELAECDAWAVVPAEEWAGETYNYDEVRAHWDAGSLERGDKRGLVVSVRRKLVVLTSFATFYDDRRG